MLIMYYQPKSSSYEDCMPSVQRTLIYCNKLDMVCLNLNYVVLYFNS